MATIITKIGKSSLIRPTYAPGLLLQDDDLTQAVEYTRNLHKLLFRTMLGCGVMCGFTLTPTIECGNKLKIDVQKGMALDAEGNVVEMPENQTLVYDPGCDQKIKSPLWVSICRADISCAPRDAMCSSDETMQPTYTRAREGYRLEISDDQPRGYCPCASETKGEITACCGFIAIPQDPAYVAHYKGICACDCGCGNCVILGQIIVTDDGKNDPKAVVDYSVSRYIRPVLVRDPRIAAAEAAKIKPYEQAAQSAGDNMGAEKAVKKAADKKANP